MHLIWAVAVLFTYRASTASEALVATGGIGLQPEIQAGLQLEVSMAFTQRTCWTSLDTGFGRTCAAGSWLPSNDSIFGLCLQW
jgi:hypothetical protein